MKYVVEMRLGTRRRRRRRKKSIKTYDDLTRRPVFCFLAGRRFVGVTARDPTTELPSP